MKRRITKSFVPNLLTTANLFCGFASLVYSADGDFQKAALFILLGAFFDMMDGVTARLINAASEFGGELDSLCDVVTFGVAPSYMLFMAYFNTFGELGILYASLPAIMGALRLARFNVQLTSLEDKDFFTGMPIPAAALTIVSYIIFFQLDPSILSEYKDILMFFVTILTSLVMVSNFKFFNTPKPSLKNIKEKPFVFIITIIVLISIFWSKGFLIFPFMLIYISLGIVLHFISWLKSGDEYDEESSTDIDYEDLEEYEA